MPWLRMDDSWTEHPKLAGLSDRAFRMYTRSMTYSSRSLTDGFIPRQHALAWGSLKRCYELVSAGAWHDERTRLLCNCQTAAARGLGFYVHDFLQWNDSKVQVVERRRKDSERKAERNHPGFTGPRGIGEGEGNLKTRSGGFVHPLDRQLGGDDG